jgi:hypothetical protein
MIIYLLLIIIILLIVILINNKENYKNINPYKKIALLFLIYDEINQEELWYNWLKNIDINKYSIYIHYKIPSNNKKLKYFEHNKIKNSVETKWGDISLVKAQNCLIENALKDSSNTNFIFLSNSCIPLKTFSYLYNFLDINKSYFNLAKSNQIFPRYDKLKKYIDINYIQKASQWCILSRKHANILYNDRNIYYEWYIDVNIPDESAYITYLNYKKLQNELITTNNSANNATTFTNWSDMDYKYKGGSPKYYEEISDEELDYLIKESKCLFGRKFKSTCNLFFLKKQLLYNLEIL